MTEHENPYGTTDAPQEPQEGSQEPQEGDTPPELEAPPEPDAGAPADEPDDDSAVSRQVVRDEDSGELVERTTYPDGGTEDAPHEPDAA